MTQGQPQKSLRRCPHCFAALPESHVLRSCPIGRRDDGRPCARSNPAWVPLAEVSRVDRCPDHAVALVERCHIATCLRPLPPQWHEITTTCIAMAGTRSSGKTVYLKVAATHLLKWGRINGITVTHYSDEFKRQFESRFGRLTGGSPLYAATEPEIPGAATAAAHQTPVLLRLQRVGLPDHVLVLRDVAGENLQNAAMDRNHFRFLANADGMILLVDPSDSPEVRVALDGIVSLPSTDFDPAAVWGNLERLQTAVVGEAANLVPLAVTISKFDLVSAAAENPRSTLSQALSARGSRMRQDPSLLTGGADWVDLNLLDWELRSLLAYLGHPQLIQAAQRYSLRAPVRFFAVSSLGSAPVMNRVASHGTVPFRCLDPLKWFLGEAGLFPASPFGPTAIPVSGVGGS